MRRILVAVLEGLQADLADYLIARASRDGVHVVVVNVQPRPMEWQTRGLYREVIKQHLIERGARACGLVTEKLARAGIAHHTRVELGDEMTELLRCAEEEACEEVLFKAPPLGRTREALMRLTGLVAGSTVARLVHSSNRPVTVLP